MNKKGILLGLMSTICLGTAAGCGQEPKYQVSTTVANEEYGSISGGGKYELGQTVRIKVYPNTGCMESGLVFKANAEDAGSSINLEAYTEEVDGTTKVLYYYHEFALTEEKIGSYNADFSCSSNTESDLDSELLTTYSVSYEFPGKNHTREADKVAAGRKVKEVNFVDGIDGIITWYTDAEFVNEYDFTKSVTADMTLYGSIDDSVKSIVGLALDKFHKEEEGLKIEHKTDTEADYAIIRNIHLYDAAEDNMDVLELVLRGAGSTGVKKIIEDGKFYEKITTTGSSYEYTGLELDNSGYRDTAYGFFSAFTPLVGLDLDDYLIEVDGTESTTYYLKNYTKVKQGETEVATVSDNEFTIGETEYTITNGAVINGNNKYDITSGSFKIGETTYTLETVTVHTLNLAKNEKGYKLTGFDNYKVSYGSDNKQFAGVSIDSNKVAMKYVIDLKASGSVPTEYQDYFNTKIMYDSTSGKSVIETIKDYFDVEETEEGVTTTYGLLNLVDYKLYKDANGVCGTTEFTASKVNAHTTVHLVINGDVRDFVSAYGNNVSTQLNTIVKAFGEDVTKTYNYVAGVDTTIYDVAQGSGEGEYTLTNATYNTLQAIKATYVKVENDDESLYNYDHVTIEHTATNETVYHFYETEHSRDAYLTVTVGEYALTSDATVVKLLIKSAVYFDQDGDENTYTTTFTYSDYTQVTTPAAE